MTQPFSQLTYLNNEVIKILLNHNNDIGYIKKNLLKLQKAHKLLSSKNINPYLFINRPDEILEICNIINDPTQKLLLLSGTQGTGKTSLIKTILSSYTENTMLFWYECSKISILDDLLLSLSTFFDRKLSKDTMFKPSDKMLMVDEKLVSYLNKLDKNLIIVLDSLEHIVTTNYTIKNEDIKEFFNFLLDKKHVKLILIGNRIPSADLNDSHDFITDIKISGLDKFKAINLLKDNSINAHNDILTEIYNYTRGYPWLLLLFSKISNFLHIPPSTIIAELMTYENSFESYLIHKIYDNLNPNERNLLNYLSVIRHPVTTIAMTEYPEIFIDCENALDTLEKLMLVVKSGKRYSLNNTVRKYVYNLLTTDQRLIIHKKISQLYLTEIAKKLAKRTIRLSRKLLHSEQHHHNYTASQTATNRMISAENNNLYSKKTEAIKKEKDNKNITHEYNNYDYSYKLDFNNMKQSTNNKPKRENMIDIDGFKITLTDEEKELLEDTEKEKKEDNIIEEREYMNNNATKEEYILDDDISEENIFFENNGHTSSKVPETDSKKSIKKNIISEDTIALADSLRFIAKGYATGKKYKIALERYNESLEISRSINDEEGIAQTLIGKGEVFFYLNQYHNALRAYEESYELYNKLEDYTDISKITMLTGNVYSNCFEHTLALEKYNEVLNMIPEQVPKLIKAQTYLGIAEIHNYQKEYKNALSNYSKALKTYRIINDKNNESIIYSKAALIFDDIGDYEKALQYYNKALELNRELENKSLYASNLSNIASVYDEIGDKEKAINYFKQAFILDKDLENQNEMYKTLSRIGTIYVELGNIKTGMKYYQQELSIAKILKNPYLIAMAYLDVGDLYYYSKNYESAAKNFILAKQEIKDTISTDSKEKIDKRINKLLNYLTQDKLKELEKGLI